MTHHILRRCLHDKVCAKNVAANKVVFGYKYVGSRDEVWFSRRDALKFDHYVKETSFYSSSGLGLTWQPIEIAFAAIQIVNHHISSRTSHIQVTRGRAQYSAQSRKILCKEFY